ncbi:uncharacterized protein NP_6164A (plasmid) [Natronomonas pharaonis DSM 2160]|uniref:Uncharacterized protein n=1 Tax=Natronomonas pharaonis (strain ATCC 35678 / DSM 2160 / CIP 103997 / JCM 8858 / NBRC 14720 / NCIMB 2260 / Gabara) TaxID=348780 RepID=Q3IM06_NATPD|nr:uncharacterized protein NP_6164A [Natronomonas pharaonis DSM 2160]
MIRTGADQTDARSILEEYGPRTDIQEATRMHSNALNR